MKKQHWIFLSIFLVVLGIGIASALSFRASLQSFTPLDENVASIPVWIEPDFGNQNKAILELTGKDLAAQAELAVVVTPTGTRRATSYATLSTFKVEQVLKENGTVTAGDTIFVYEAPVAEPGKLVNLNGFHPFMKEGRSYLLLLNFYQRPEGWDYSEENLKTYLLIDGYYGQFPVEEPKFMIVHESDVNGKPYPPYSEIADYDCAYMILEGDTPESNSFRKNYTRLQEELLTFFVKT